MSGPSGSGRIKVCGSRKEFSGREGGTERGKNSLGNVARRSSDSSPLALPRKAFGWETEMWDLTKLAKTEADFLGEEQLGKL